MNNLNQRIIKKFGEETFDVLERKPEKLSQIKGISPEKAMLIGQIFHEQIEIRECMLFLQKYNISPIYAMKIYKHYKQNTINVIKTNPYRLADDIWGIGFKIADNIAESIGIEKDSNYRIKAGIKYILNISSNSSGNVYLPESILIEQTSMLLNLEKELIFEHISSLQLDRQISIEKTQSGNIVFLNSYYYAEQYTAKKLLELSFFEEQNKNDYDKIIKQIEKTENIKFAKKQKDAIKLAMTKGVLVITGGPGTGKTTTIKTIIKLLKEENYEIELAAPTGRAAKRITETTDMEAQTIHRLLGINFVADDKKRQTFEKNEDNPIEADVIIIDESSMIDILLMNNLLKAIALGTRLILVGDVDQLPSVGAGNVLKDIIDSECVQVIKLNEVFRQAQQSAIVMNAHKINKGIYPSLNENNKDFFFIKKYNPDEIIQTIVQLVTTRLPKYLNCKNISDIQVLCPMRKSKLGVFNLNNYLQNAINPPSSQKNEKDFRDIVFREGDKVMQIKNNYNMVWKVFDKNRLKIDEGVGVFNGDEGIISTINNNNEYIDVLFDESKLVRYDFTQLDELDLSYATTIHKAQGSEYPAVVIPLHSSTPMLFNRNLLYTAITRARQLVVIIGIPETLKKMVDNKKEVDRFTSLKNKIINLNKFMKG